MNGTERAAAASAMFRDRGVLRMGIHGASMLPSLATPMVLQLGNAHGARIGDVLVFWNGEVDVAHRVVAIEANGFRTAGDAQPHVVEAVPFERVVGRVVAVWSDASAGGRRVDDRRHRLRGWYFARFHRLRRRVHIASNKARDLIERARPQRRARVAPRLVEAIAAVVRSDPARLVAALTYDADALGPMEDRHRCAAMFGDAARRLGVVGQLPPEVAAGLRRARLDAVIATGRMERALDRTVTVLRSAGIEFALLKGAARVYGKLPGAAFHPSDDIDVFVDARAVDDTERALLAHGWTCPYSADERERFRRHHHHAAPLDSPDGEFPVEIHHALAPPGTLSSETTWTALRERLVRVDGIAGPALQLDRVATAFHLAVHAIGLTRLRDIALLAFLLPAMTAAERGIFESMLAAERRDPVRLAAAAALAARTAGIAFPERAGVAAYVQWALRREDLPLRLRRRSDAADLCFARPGAPWAAMPQLAPWWTHGADVSALPLRIVGRCATSAFAAAYAARMPEEGVPSVH